jgi:hypothetical protein
MTPKTPVTHEPNLTDRCQDNRDVEDLVVKISEMDLDALRLLWRQKYGEPPPLRSLPILRLQLAWRVQADAFGGIDKPVRKTLSQTGRVEMEGKHLGIGAALTRNWKGRKVTVVIEEEGFKWEGRIFPSLSAAATAIAGCRWNGPRFFGLRDTP